MRMKKLAVMALATALSVGSVMTASAAWLQEGSNWRYQNDNGTFQTGTWFRDADGRWYHFDNNGIMQKGWFQDADGKWYFLAYNGVMQVGLIKVDNQVYYMNASGDLFLGDMTINGKTYNFGLYGTTNGQPIVPASATYGGNGNQSLNGGGGGSSSNGGGGSTATTPTDVKEAVSKVQNVANDFKGSAAVNKIVVGDIKKVGSNYKVAVTIEAKEPAKEEEIPAFVKEAQATVEEVVGSMLADLDDETDVTITVPTVDGKDSIKKTYKASDWHNKLDVLAENYITSDSYKNNSGKTATVVVELESGKVTYTISLAK